MSEGKQKTNMHTCLKWTYLTVPLSHIVLEIRDKVITQEKSHQNWKGKSKPWHHTEKIPTQEDLQKTVETNKQIQ